MRKPVSLITGAGGEIGHGLIARLGSAGTPIVTLDITPLDPALLPSVTRVFTGSITDTNLLDRILAEFEIEFVFHLAALLSTRAEFTPVTAHHVNVEGTLNLLEFAQRQGESHGRPVVFVYPSSIAAYGIGGPAAKMRAGRVREDDFARPKTMYGCNKLYCEQLGRYYAFHYKQLSADATPHVDFRCVRFPGLISGSTLPSGGTSDYASEMIHASAKGQPYACFVRPDTTLPFLAMPDAVDALLTLGRAPKDRLTRTAYNVTAFSAAAADIREVVLRAFPRGEIIYQVDPKRQGIVDSWPADLDDSAARADWGFNPTFGFDRAFSEYLIPTIRERYHPG
ncbi:MAG: NAD-dependent epimerase/dehydratase family protein [Acidobacteriota bacterium]